MKKVFGVINFIDLIIMAVVVAVGVFGYFYLSSGGFKSGNSAEIHYTVEFEGLPKGFHEIIDVGTDVKDSIKGYYLGTVEDLEVLPSVDWRLNEETRQYTEITLEEEEIVRVKIRAHGMENDERIVLEDNPVRVGQRMYIEGKGFVWSGYVIALETQKEGN